MQNANRYAIEVLRWPSWASWMTGMMGLKGVPGLNLVSELLGGGGGGAAAAADEAEVADAAGADAVRGFGHPDSSARAITL